MDIAKLKIIKTLDDSGTLYVSELDEHYHSVNGAMQESMHVFVNAGLRHLSLQNKELKILEIGFGTGLNALVTFKELQAFNGVVRYLGLEKFPLPLSIIEQLNYIAPENNRLKKVFKKMHASQWGKPEEIDANFYLHKVNCDVTEGIEFTGVDLVYFDAFAPDKQPLMWEQDVFQSLFEAMNLGGVLVTYCAKGEVRRRMQRVGFTVERLAGPPGKREMLRATK